MRRPTSVLLVVVSVVAAAAAASSGSGTFTNASLTVGRELGSTISTPGLAAFGGGTWCWKDGIFGCSVTNQSSRVDFFDGTQWSTGSLSVNVSRLASAAIKTGDGKNLMLWGGGFLGGYAKSDVIDAYEPSTASWTHKWGTLSEARSSLAAAAFGSVVLFAGGINSTSVSDTVDIYDTSAGGAAPVHTTAKLSVARGYLVPLVCSSTGVLLFAGGEQSVGDSSAVDMYSVKTKSWTTSSLSTQRSLTAGACNADGTVCAIAGGAAEHTVSNTIDVFDCSKGVWSMAKGTLSAPSSRLAATFVQSTVFFAGGENDNGPLANIDALDTMALTVTPHPHLRLPVSRLMAASVGGSALFAGGLQGLYCCPNDTTIFTP